MIFHTSVIDSIIIIPVIIIIIIIIIYYDFFLLILRGVVMDCVCGPKEKSIKLI